MEKTLFNQGWKFWEDTNSFALIWDGPADAAEVTLPHDAMLLKKAYADCKNSNNTGFRDGGVYAYSKKFTPVDEDKTYAVHFEGVYSNAVIYVNQQLAYNCPYGYTGFTVMLNDFLRFGQENEIRVSVHNSASENSRWYSGSGIYRDVYMLTGGQAYLKYQGTYTETEAIYEDGAVIKVSSELVNNTGRRLDGDLLTEVIDAEGQVVASKRIGCPLFAGETQTVSHRMHIADAKTWDDEHPYLYTLRVSLMEKDNVLDTDVHTFGIRTLTVDAHHGFRVNGREVNLRGGCIHHDNGIVGAECSYEMEYRRVSKMKEAGFNAIRMAHNPAAPALLRACDELGMYVMDEAFDMWTRSKGANDYSLWFDKWWKDDIEAMVRKDRLSPSVVMYSIGNEIPEIGSDQGASLCRQINNFVHSLDDTRYTLAGINGVFALGDDVNEIMASLADGEFHGNVNDFMTIMDTKMPEIVTHPLMERRIDKACASLDIAGYNYMTARYKVDADRNPDRVIVGSETYGPQIPENWAIIKEQHNVIGDFTWTGWDYIGEAGVGVCGYAWGEGGFGASFPKQLAYVGDIDITGFRRPASYFREIVFGLRTNPYIVTQNPYKYGQHLIATPWVISDSIASWTYPDMEGKPIVVEIYSAGDSVELIKNGVSLGRQPVEGFIARFDTTFESGSLEAVSYAGDKEIGRDSISSAVDADLVTELSYEKGDFLYFDLVNKDAGGNVDTHTVKHITVNVEGDYEHRLGSGSYEPAANYTEDSCDTFLGRAQLIVRKKSDGSRPVVKVIAE